MIKNVKKVGTVYIPIMILILVVLCSSLAGCKKFSMPEGFNADFGKSGRGDFNGIRHFDMNAKPLEVWKVLEENYKNVPYAANRQLTELKTGKLLTQNITVTRIKKTEMGKTRVFNEDAVIATGGTLQNLLALLNNITQVMSEKDDKNGSYKVRKSAYDNVEINSDTNLISLRVKDRWAENNTFDNADDYKKENCQDIYRLTHFIINEDTVNLEESKLESVDSDFAKLTLVLKPTESTEDYRRLIAKNGDVDVSKVSFNKAKLEVLIWKKTALVRNIKSFEDYNLIHPLQGNVNVVINYKENQTGNSAGSYFSYDFLELPLKQFEY